MLGRKGDELVEIPGGGASASSGKSEVQRETSSWNTRPRRKTKPAGFFSQIREALEAQHMARNLHHRVSYHMHIQNAIPELRSKTRGTVDDAMMMAWRPVLPMNRQARASPAFRDSGNAHRWKVNQDREMFHTLFAIPHAGAGTDFWLRLTGPYNPSNRQATAGPHQDGWCTTTGAKCTLHLWRRRANALGMARRVSCPDRVFAHDCFVGSQPQPAKSQALATGLHICI